MTRPKRSMQIEISRTRQVYVTCGTCIYMKGGMCNHTKHDAHPALTSCGDWIGKKLD